MHGSQPYATYRIKRANWREAEDLSTSIKQAFEEHGMIWIKDYFINSSGGTLEIEIYSQAANELLKETVPQYLL